MILAFQPLGRRGAGTERVMSNLAIGFLAAFSIATVAFVGVSFGSDLASAEEGDIAVEHANGPGAVGDDDAPREEAEQPRVRRSKAVSSLAEVPGLDSARVRQNQLTLPTNLPPLTNHLPTRPEVPRRPDLTPIENNAMRLAERTLDVLVGHLERLEHVQSQDEGMRELLAMQRKLSGFEQQWRRLEGKLSPAFKQRIEDYARKRAGDLPKRVAEVARRFTSPPPNVNPHERPQPQPQIVID